MKRKILYVAAGITTLLIARRFGPALIREIKLVCM
jgi:hypothetical protein